MTDDREKQIEAYIQKDPFAQRLGARVEILAPGHSRVTLVITEDMANFHGITHGGVVFALGDMAFAAASNSRGQTAVALNVAIHFLKATRPGDRNVVSGDLVARSQDLVYRKKEWFVPET